MLWRTPANVPSDEWMQRAKDINRKRSESTQFDMIPLSQHVCVPHGVNRVIKVVVNFRNGERIILFNVLAPYFLHVFPLRQMGKMHPKYTTIGETNEERDSHGRTVANNNFTIEFIQNGLKWCCRAPGPTELKWSVFVCVWVMPCTGSGIDAYPELCVQLKTHFIWFIA